MGLEHNKRGGRRPGRFNPTREGIAYVSLLSTADRIRGFFDSIVSPFDITAQQYNVLRILRGAEPDGLPTLTVAERMIERAPGITRMIDRLEVKGLAQREARSGDRRCVRCRISPKGLALLQQLEEPVANANRAAFRGLTKTELDQLIDLLGKARQAHERE